MRFIRSIAMLIALNCSWLSVSYAQDFFYTMANTGSASFRELRAVNNFTTPNTLRQLEEPGSFSESAVLRFGPSLNVQNLFLRGNVQVSAFGSGQNAPTNIDSRGVISFERGDRPNELKVSSFGVRSPDWVDRGFAVLVTRPVDARLGQLAFALLDRPTAVGYNAEGPTSFGRGSMRVLRTGRGLYEINLDPLADTGATVQATAVSDQPRYCSIVSWSAGTVKLSCFDSDGNPADSAVSLLAVSDAMPGVSFLWSGRTSGGPLPSQYQHSTSTMVTQNVVRNDIGDYLVTLGPEANTGGHAQVTAYGSNAYCYLDETARQSDVIWASNSVNVKCTRAGEFVDSSFSVMAITRQFVVPRTTSFGGDTPQTAHMCPTWPAMTSGDMEFGNNGATVTASITLAANPTNNRVELDITFTANENNGGDTRMGMRLISTVATIDQAYTITGVIPGGTTSVSFSSRGPAFSGEDRRVFQNRAFVRTVEIIGDTGGDDISRDFPDCSDDTRLQKIMIAPVIVRLAPR